MKHDARQLHESPGAAAMPRQAATESDLRHVLPFTPPLSGTCRRHRLRARMLRAGRDAMDDGELLEILLAGRRGVPDAEATAAILIETFGTAPRALAARPDRLRSLCGLSDDAVAALNAAEALGIRMARAKVPDTYRPLLDSPDAIADWCRTLCGHRETEEFHLLFLDRRNALIADERHQHGTVAHTPAYPREICVRALETAASTVIAVHNHPGDCPQASRGDIEMTRRIRDALKTIDVLLADHVIVTSTGAFSFRAKGLL